MRHVGVLMNSGMDDERGQARLAAFLQGLQQLGWTEGRNVRVDVDRFGRVKAVAARSAGREARAASAKIRVRSKRSKASTTERIFRVIIVGRSML